MLKAIDSILDRVTMYRLALYYLIALLVIATTLSQLGYLHYSPVAIVLSATTLLVVCWITNQVFSAALDAPSNSESTLITALILALIISPPTSLFSFTFLLAAGGLAIASKYLLTIRRKHIFNPASVAVALTALGPRQTASWWIGTAVMLPFVLVGGILLVRKIRRSRMVASFLATSFVATVVYTILSKGSIIGSLDKAALSSSLFFLAFVMLTEPATSPPTEKKQMWYGVLAGLLLPPQVHILGVYSSPELTLVVSNVFSYLVSPKTKLFPVLKEKLRITPDAADFIFTTDRKLKYKPGQYMEWTLPHDRPDNRGSRRYFTLASSPTEDTLRLGIKFYAKGSSFKHAMWSMDANTPIVASQLSGDFTLPKDKKRKLVFIAGGIGVTPFRSMLKYLLDTNDYRPVTLFYSERNAGELAYSDVLSSARQNLGTKIIYTLTDPNIQPPEGMRVGQITPRLIAMEVPDYMEREFYIAGSHQMVTSIKEGLRSLGVQDHAIKIDFFPGYA